MFASLTRNADSLRAPASIAAIRSNRTAVSGSPLPAPRRYMVDGDKGLDIDLAGYGSTLAQTLYYMVTGAEHVLGE